MFFSSVFVNRLTPDATAPGAGSGCFRPAKALAPGHDASAAAPEAATPQEAALEAPKQVEAVGERAEGGPELPRSRGGALGGVTKNDTETREFMRFFVFF